MNEEYKEIFKLKDMLDKAGIEYEWIERDNLNGYQICCPSDADRYVSVIENDISYGHENDLLEIMGLLTPEEEEQDEAKGRLTAENVFERIKKYNESKAFQGLTKGTTIRTITVLELIKKIGKGDIPDEVIYDGRIWFYDDDKSDYLDWNDDYLTGAITGFGVSMTRWQNENIQIIE